MGYSWPFALTAVFVEGIIFIILPVTGLRQRIVDSMPLILRRAISPGIGLFLAFIGLKNAGLVVASDSTFVTLGNFHSPTVLLAYFGILLSSVLLVRKVNFQEYVTAIPCFICIVTMPLTYSISDGILLGLITYVFLQAFTGKWKEVNLGSYILAVLFLLKYSLL